MLLGKSSSGWVERSGAANLSAVEEPRALWKGYFTRDPCDAQVSVAVPQTVALW